MERLEFRLDDSAITDLQRRLDATRWLGEDTASHEQCGAPLPFVRDLCAHWRNRFDWNAFEWSIRGREQVRVPTSVVPIHAMTHDSPHADAVPILMLHGWPSAFLEFADVADRLARPADGGPAFHVIAPSLPGYGFSPYVPGLSPRRIATLMLEMMHALGHERFLIQGGNWGSSIGTEMARQAPERVIGLHLNTVNGSAPRRIAPHCRPRIRPLPIPTRPCSAGPISTYWHRPRSASPTLSTIRPPA
ncbi:epoxide hydrolase family protein [Novosphingobium album (ex Hu et al. 2023)]|uniref:Epoxide hydrolase n=1 Tax=Novosphingobium album (ex Hu et al. 2023) TaxID=2930093 RepID=A0ABT0AZL7_9SPHN|nr:epoxide hydrolase family protein [Novosphingobium album (ex Hu et al. 2023)]MCJ2178149.1 epoxide hydrolase [Novosphingobium album (ex Hu et al. 2023)]